MKERPITPTPAAIRERMAAGTAFVWTKAFDEQPPKHAAECCVFGGRLCYRPIHAGPHAAGEGGWHGLNEKPLGRVGDELWCKEVFHFTTGCDYVYRADYPDNCKARHMENIPPVDQVRWRSPVAMPKEAARILDTITAIRVERAEAEGVDHWGKAYRKGEWVWRVEVVKR